MHQNRDCGQIFVEPNPSTGKKDVVWFALNDDRPLIAFAGIWTEFHGDRGTKSKPIPGPLLVYDFLTNAPVDGVDTAEGSNVGLRQVADATSPTAGRVHFGK